MLIWLAIEVADIQHSYASPFHPDYLALQNIYPATNNYWPVTEVCHIRHT